MVLENMNINFEKLEKMQDYNAYELSFSVEGQTFVFMIGNTKDPFPLSVRHQFSETKRCSNCGRLVLPPPMGQQLCTYFQKHKSILFEYFKNHLTNK